MVAPRVPYPADHGAAQRNLALLRWLGARHHVTLVAFGNPSDVRGRTAIEALGVRAEVISPVRRSRSHRVATLLRSRAPDLAVRLHSPDLVDRLREQLAIRRPDVVQIEGLEMYEAVAAVRSAVGGTVLLDEHNAEYRLQESAFRASLRQRDPLGAVYSRIQAKRLRRYEKQACDSVDTVVAVSAEDQDALRRLGTPTPIRVIPNGVDTQYYCPSHLERDAASVLFIGKMDYRPNVDAAEWLASEIWPMVRAAVPDAKLSIVGRDPLPRVRRLVRVPGLSVIGEVPDDRAWFWRSTVLAVPLRMGGGTRLKVLQAMSTGTPIVATRIGMAGVGASEETHFLRGDTADAFARQLVRALREEETRAGLAVAARRLAVDCFEWATILDRLGELYPSTV
jgi:glycosyltransferase involved in cell wall biosynthesis